MKYSNFVKGNIALLKIKEHAGRFYHDSEKKEEIIFRVINIDDIYYFAEEISTGCIFPIYNAFVEKRLNIGDIRYFSYLKCAKYGVFYPLIGSDDIFKYKLDVNDEDFHLLKFPSADEINDYYIQKKNDPMFQLNIEKMEEQNAYMCDIKLIKERIAKLQNGNNPLCFTEKTKYEEYIPDVDLKEISDFGYDLSKQEDLCNLIGREEEIKKIIKTTCIRGKSILLVGESGSGKTSIVEKLALDIKNKQNEWLEGKTIFYLNLTSIQADTKYRGAFESNVNKIIECCKKYQGQIILFIDEIHNLYGLGRTEDTSTDAMNILKPYISNGTITIIGATTKMEYEKYMANDTAFLRRFEKLDIDLPDQQMNIQILLSYIKELEIKYNVKLELNDLNRSKIIENIVNMTDIKNQKVIGDIKISNPTLSKNIIEDAFVEAIYNKRNIVTIEDICFAVLSCDKLSPTLRKEQAEKIRNIISKKEVRNNVISMRKVKEK